MNDIYADFLNAANIMDDFSLEGFYGDDIKTLVEDRNNMDIKEYLAKTLEIWLEDTQQYGKKQVTVFMGILFQLYTNALKINAQETADTISNFWRGTKNNPELENLSAYFELSRLNQETKYYLNSLSHKPNCSIAEKHQGAKFVSNTYSKGIEFIGKTLTTCIILQKISNKEAYDFFDIDKLTVFRKINTLNSISNNQYQNLTSAINRSIRNVDSHLNLTFNHIDGTYTLRKQVNKKVTTEKITFEKMMMDIYPVVGWYTQAFVYSGILLYFALDDKERFNLLTKEILKIADSN
ncbi:hypothetical protein [Bacillus cereus]|uniref:hypothetical protein n=1 Tax=Bacillus cereus TaxID=1396 RepID=UPI0020BDA80A|nr:hypothetical protein [Bacillus cereus]